MLIRFSVFTLCLLLLSSGLPSFGKDAHDSYKKLETFLIDKGVIEGGADVGHQRAYITKALWSGGAKAEAAMKKVYAVYADSLGEAVDEGTRREFAEKSIKILEEQAGKATAAAKSLDKNGTYNRMKESDAKTDEARMYFASQRIAKHCQIAISEMKNKVGLK